MLQICDEVTSDGVLNIVSSGQWFKINDYWKLISINQWVSVH